MGLSRRKVKVPGWEIRFNGKEREPLDQVQQGEQVPENKLDKYLSKMSEYYLRLHWAGD